MSGVDPAIVRRAVELKLIDPREAPRFLDRSTPPRPLSILPKTPPPPERLTLVTRPDGRIRRARGRLTKMLIAAGVVDVDVVKARGVEPFENEENNA